MGIRIAPAGVKRRGVGAVAEGMKWIPRSEGCDWLLMDQSGGRSVGQSMESGVRLWSLVEPHVAAISSDSYRTSHMIAASEKGMLP